MKYINSYKVFENKSIDPMTLISKEFAKLEDGVQRSPSIKDLTGELEKIVDFFNLWKKEKLNVVLKNLEKLKPSIDKWDLNDESKLQKWDDGLKHAPTSQVKRVISLLQKYSEETTKSETTKSDKPLRKLSKDGTDTLIKKLNNDKYSDRKDDIKNILSKRKDKLETKLAPHMKKLKTIKKHLKGNNEKV